MSRSWVPACVGDVAEFLNRKRVPLSGRQRSATRGPYPYWGANGVLDHVNDFLFTGPHVLVGEDGTVVRADGRAVVHWVTGQFWANNHAHVLAAAPGTDLRWLYYALSAVSVRDFVSGSVQPKLSMTNLKRVPLSVPSFHEQRAIALFLDAIEAKAESNRRLADALKAILLFVPPEDGTPITLDTIAQFKNGGALTKHATGGGRPILRIKELKAGVTSDTPRTDTDVRSDHEVCSGDLLFSWSGTLLVHRWTGPDSVLNQHVFRVDPSEGFPRWFVEAWVERHLGEFRAIAADKATTMGHIQRRHLTDAEVRVPDREAMDELRKLYDPFDSQRMTALREAQALTAIRDALLPKLVSGKIRVPLSDDPEGQVGAAEEQVGAAVEELGA